jgi:hydroxymethylbilane synthase
MLKIGALRNEAGIWQAEWTQTALTQIGIASESVFFDPEGGDSGDPEQDFHAHPGMDEALARGTVQLTVHALPTLPVETPEIFAITALSSRTHPADLLVVRPEALDPARFLQLRSGATVALSSETRKRQLQEIRPDLKFQNIAFDPPTLLRQVHEGLFDAVVLAADPAGRPAPDLGALSVVELQVREFPPTPAQGVMAWRTHRDDLPTRRLLKQIHHPDVSACTNVERGLLQLLDPDARPTLGAYCERDAAGNFHAIAVCRLQGDLRRAFLSQSTNAGLAAALYKKMVTT